MGFAQSPQMGTWKLDEAQSKIPAGFAKNSTVIYAADGDNMKVTTDGTDGAGKPMHTEWTGKFDDKEYPLTGDPTADSRSYKHDRRPHAGANQQERRQNDLPAAK